VYQYTCVISTMSSLIKSANKPEPCHSYQIHPRRLTCMQARLLQAQRYPTECYISLVKCLNCKTLPHCATTAMQDSMLRWNC